MRNKTDEEIIMKHTKLLFNGNAVSAAKAAKLSGLTTYNVKKIIQHIESKMSVDFNTFDFTPYLCEEGLQEVAQRTKGTKYLLNGKSLTKPEIAKRTGCTYYQVATAIKEGNVPKGGELSHLLEGKGSTPLKRRQTEDKRAVLKGVEYLFMGQKVTIDELCSLINKTKTATLARLNKYFPLEQRIKHYRTTKAPADITDIFCWEPSKTHETGVNYFGVFDNKQLYELDGLPLAIDQVIEVTGLTKSSFYNVLSKELKIEPSKGHFAEWPTQKIGFTDKILTEIAEMK